MLLSCVASFVSSPMVVVRGLLLFRVSIIQLDKTAYVLILWFIVTVCKKNTMNNELTYSPNSLRKVSPHELTLHNLFTDLTLYAPCIILQYVYKPTRSTKFF